MASSRWKTVNFEELGANVANADFEGLIGFEECLDYDVFSSKKGSKRKLKLENDNKISTAKTKKPKSSNNKVEKPKLNKTKTNSSKINGTVSLQKTDVSEITENSGNEVTDEPVHVMQLMKLTKKTKKKKKKPKNKKPLKKTNDDSENNNSPIEENKPSLTDMHAWSNFGIPEPIIKALADQGFSKPTTIQELTLPAAMHGRRDILGAAETGSGKTLAFGIPILSGILAIKEKLSRGETETKHVQNKKSIYSFEDEKVISVNKYSENAKMKLKKQKQNSQKIRNALKYMKARRNEDTDDESNESESDIDEPDDESSESESVDLGEGDSDDECDKSSGNDIENNEVSDNKDSENEESDNEGSKSNEPDIEGSENDKDSENEDSENEDSENEGSESVDSDEDKPKNKIRSNQNNIKNSDSESDFEEREEQVNGMNQNGIGCVRVIDNIGSIEPAENNIIKHNLKPLYALILTPTRELAIQVTNHLVAAAKHTDIRVAVVVGGMAQVKQERILEKGPEIVVATPGRLWEMIQQGNDHLSQVNDIRYLAIDETDRMIERGHFEELHHLLDKINDDENKKALRQNFVFSATLTLVHELPLHLKSKKVTKRGKIIKKKFQKLTSEQKLKKVIELLGITNPKVVDVTEKNRGSSNTLMECRISCPIDHKDYYLYYVLKRHPGRTIVFCNSIGCVKRLAQLFGLLMCKPLPLHASMQQRQRLKNLDKFRNDPNGLLIATDVAARGLDIPNVDHVIHYQVPRTAENYVHRSGRTARASKEGITILIMEPGEVQNYVKFCRTLSKAEDLPHFPVTQSLLAATKQRVNLAREVDQLELRMRKTNSEIGWYEKSMREMDIVLDEREMPQKMDKATAAEQKSLLTIKKKQLNSLLSAHIFPKGFSFKYPTSNNMLENSVSFGQNQNAVEVMKSALESGLIKQLKRTTKNQAHLSLANEKADSYKSQNKTIKKNKWKKMKRNKNVSSQ